MKVEQNSMKGLSITLCFGSYGGFYMTFSKYCWRICLGWVALAIYPQTDIENYITNKKTK